MTDLLAFAIKLVTVLAWLSLFVERPQPRRVVDGLILCNREWMK